MTSARIWLAPTSFRNGAVVEETKQNTHFTKTSYVVESVRQPRAFATIVD